MWVEHRVEAMGTEAQIVVAEHDRALLERAAARLADLEQRWSRFLPDSELSHVNRSPGSPVIVSTETFELISRAVDAWRGTDGRYDPTVHDALVALGYDRTFADLPDRVATGPDSTPSPGAAEVDLDQALCAVTVPAGVRLDLGGIGKGAAADLVVSEAREAGAAGIGVNIGGDARMWGSGPTRDGWTAVLRCPGSHQTRTFVLTDGAACTTTRLKRRWRTDRGSAHHIVDPRTGASAATGVASVGVVAATAAQAEVLAKAAFLAGPGEGVALLRSMGVAGALVADDGVVHDVVPAASTIP